MKYKIQNTYHESTLKTLEKSGKIYFIYTTLEYVEITKIDTQVNKGQPGSPNRDSS